ncbi:DUF3037 domain-containing protein [Flavobacterium sp. CFS9]|jgi:hypothetical protein|uniref:DUF3037 domain-containing protein n=4 Tax=Flavobacterium TaxID=237 RepID=A0A1S1JAU0_9FLAO|nr:MULTISPECIES: DUF3037 domain-containing protein [Flavobacterium]MCC9019422.1 DUF3037 domain-containing protein [Flavobacterium sp. F-126]MDL2142230.1 DUF3037 domain-containing protein [Flavobacterium tructae]OHT45403.1 hypothetical protein BHE19_06060 [Flavobacterium tructae]OXB18062.1 hypothetical protein B0A71_14070 [Flavobacterium tructae]OXB19044.1 hypothetical protein B0A80_19890 [Flavobacterium tructae]
MQDNHLYEYAVIRVVPRVEREEFLNIGIILFCKKKKFIKVLFHLNKERIQALSADFDIEQLECNLTSLEKIVNGAKDGGPIAEFEIPERFRWLTAIRSSAIQTSRPHPGLCQDLEKTIQRLFEELVL